MISESTDIIEARPDSDRMPTSRLIARQQDVHEVLTKVMRPNVDYGVIPGTKQPTLFKPGAEKIGLTFGIAVVMDTLETTVTETEVYYRVRAQASDRHGNVLGTHEAVCSTREKKYRWRRPVCQEEYDEAPVGAKQTTWAKDRSGKGYRVQSVRMDVGEVIHTLLAMAQKRAYTGVIMRVTGASDIFSVEDEPAGGPPNIEDLLAAYDQARDEKAFARLEEDREEIWPKIAKADQAILKRASDLARNRITDANKPQPAAEKSAP